MDNSHHYHHHDINSSPQYNTLPPIFPHNNTTSQDNSNVPSIIADTLHPNPLHYHPDSPQPWNTEQHHLHSDEAEHLIQTLPPLRRSTQLITTPSTSDPSAYHHQSTRTFPSLQHTPSSYNHCTRNTQPAHLHRSFIHQPGQEQSMTETNSYWPSPYTHSPFNYAQASRPSTNSASTTNIARNHQSPSPTLFVTPDATVSLSTPMPQLQSQQSIIDLISDDESQNPPRNRHAASKRARTPNSANPSKRQKLSTEIGVLDLSDVNTDSDYLAKQAAEKEAAQKEKALKESEKPIKLTTMDCIICLDTPTDLTVTWCGHLFCSHCLHEALLADPRKKCCPICRQSISTALKPAANKSGVKLPRNGVYPLSMKLMTTKRKGKLVDEGNDDEARKEESQAEKDAREEYERFSKGAATHWGHVRVMKAKEAKEAKEAREADDRLQASANDGGSNVAANVSPVVEAEILQDFDFDGFLADNPADEWQ